MTIPNMVMVTIILFSNN